jgi:CRISPR-associated exonuclease Cas4
MGCDFIELIIVALFCFFLSIILIKISLSLNSENRDIRNINKIPKGKIIYSDLNKIGKVFYSKKYKIAGKPDYIVKFKKYIIPVEFKSALYKKPEKNHIIQLAAYCHLIEEDLGVFTPFGFLIYGNKKAFKIPFNPTIRYDLEKTIYEIRKQIKSKNIKINHNNPNKCLNCSLRIHCPYKIK